MTKEELDRCLSRIAISLTADPPRISSAQAVIEEYAFTVGLVPDDCPEGITGETSIADDRLGLSLRTLNCLENLGIMRLEQVFRNWPSIERITLSHREVLRGLKRVGITKTDVGFTFRDPLPARSDPPNEHSWTSNKPVKSGWYWVWCAGQDPTILYLNVRKGLGPWKLFCGPLREPLT